MDAAEQRQWIARIDTIRARAAERLAAWQNDPPQDKAQQVHDRKDDSERFEQDLLRAEQVRIEQRILRAAMAARERVASGTFGRCVDCGGAVSAERLAAQPTASRCLACQGNADRHAIY